MDFSNITSLSSYVQQFGPLAPVIAFTLFTLQAILPVFPYVIMASISGILFGFKIGFLLSWLGALTGACIAFWIIRLLGYESFLNRFYSRFNYDLRTLDSSLAFWSILAVRVIPIVPTPIINVASALGGVSFFIFFFSSAIGKIPSAFLYTGLGLALFNSKDINTAISVLSIALILILITRYLLRKFFPK